MSQTYTINGREIVTLDAPVSLIRVYHGTIAVFSPDVDLPELAQGEGETKALEYRPGRASLDIYSGQGASLAVTFENELAEATAAPQDASEAPTGGLGDKSLEELREIATERDLAGRGGLNKADLVALIEEAEKADG
jgi:hypothetical protein